MITRKHKRGLLTVIAGHTLAVLIVPTEAQARDRHHRSGFNISFHFSDAPRHVRRHRPRYRNYYPRYYRYWNPVVRKDVTHDGYSSHDGRHHSERVVEDRHASYYSPGRNTAVTEPRTRVTRQYGPHYERRREQTRWIGADGRPHSTTVAEVTTYDRYGNSHTETHVTLKNKEQKTDTMDNLRSPGKRVLIADKTGATRLRKR